MKMNLPNKLTIFRAVLIPFIIVLQIIEGINIDGCFLNKEIGLGINWCNILVLIIFVVASFTDFLDGFIARKYNLVTDFGKFLDPLADKLLVCTTMIYLVQEGRFDFFNISFAFVVAIIIAREFAVTGLRLLAVTKNGEVMAAKILGKSKTVCQILMVIVLLLNSFGVEVIGFIFAMASLLLALISGIDYFVKSKGIFKE